MAVFTISRGKEDCIVPDNIAPENIVTVPDMSAADLVALAKQNLALTHLDEDLPRWDFIQDERGKRYEVLIWSPGRDVVATDTRAYFSERKFNGNTAAFIAWVVARNPEGYWASTPDEAARLWRDPRSRRLCALRFIRDGADSWLNIDFVGNGWGSHWSLVAFREIP